MNDIWSVKIAILGAGDRGTASALRLFRAGFRPVIIEIQKPTDLHYLRTFSDAVYKGSARIEDITAAHIPDALNSADMQSEIVTIQKERQIPILAGDTAQILEKFSPEIIIDCRGKFRAPDSFSWEEFPLFISTQLQDRAGQNAHVLIDTVGRVCTHAEESGPNAAHDHIIRAPIEGVFIADVQPGEAISERAEIGNIAGISIQAPSHGVVTGILHSGHFVFAHQELVEITPERRFSGDWHQLPFEAIAVSGGVLEAVLTTLFRRSRPY
jgi:xanthine dehydrogenase accessory factor